MDILKPTKMEAKLLPVSTLTVEQDNGTEKVYQCVLDFNAVIKCETEINRDITKPESWVGLKHTELSAIAWASLDRFHPDVTLRELRQWLNPKEWAEVFCMYFEQMFPGALELQRQRIAEAEKTPGKDEPSATTKA